jgi:hypothetical protein
MTAVATAFLLGAGTVSADTFGGDVNQSQNGATAFMYAQECPSNGDGTTTCHTNQLALFAGKTHDKLTGDVSHGNLGCLSVDTSTFDDETGDVLSSSSESGCVENLPSAALSIDNLASARLATTITIETFVCDDETGICVPISSRDVAVDATWTGFGPVASAKSRDLFDDGICRVLNAGKSLGRDASFSGTIDGSPVQALIASLSDGRSTFVASGCGG